MLIRTVSIATAIFPPVTRFSRPRDLFRIFSRSLCVPRMDCNGISNRFSKTRGLNLEQMRTNLDEYPHTVIPRCLYSIGQDLYKKGEYQEAASYFEQAILAHREIYGNRAKFYVAFVLTSLGKTWKALGNEERLRECLREKYVLQQIYLQRSLPAQASLDRRVEK